MDEIHRIADAQDAAREDASTDAAPAGMRRREIRVKSPARNDVADDVARARVLRHQQTDFADRHLAEGTIVDHSMPDTVRFSPMVPTPI